MSTDDDSKQARSTVVSPSGTLPPVSNADPAAQVINPKNTNYNSMTSYGMPPELTSGMLFGEVGTSGLRAYSGWVREEFLPELQGRQAASRFREMMDNSPVVGAIMFAVVSTMRKVDWRVEPNEDAPTGPAQEAADFVETLMNDMSHTWEDLVVENLSMLGYGYAPHEIVYKPRLGKKPGNDKDGNPLPSSDYEDGKIGWRRIPIRGQDTVLKWFFDPYGQVTGMTQQPWTGRIVDIPIEKMLLFRPSQHKGNPEGRDCTLDTKVRTPRGWTTMGDIRVGDQVYDETGTIRNVTGKTEIFKNRPVYEVEFTTGATVKTGATHRWSVTNDNDRTCGRTPREMTTEQIAACFDVEIDARTMRLPTEQKWKHRRARSISCGIAQVLQAPDVTLPLDPYVLGYWLGDGMTKEARISVCGRDLYSLQQELKKAGFDRSHHNGETTLSIPGGLLFALRAAGVFTNKHVPQSYMLASPAQRLALLQGLMDSDGYSPGIDSKDEASTFANTNRRLVDAVIELVRSLGGQPRERILEEAGALGGVINGHQIVAKQTSYEVRFMLDLPVHRLPRKRHAQVLRKTHRNSAHFIRSVQRVENADTVCIEVDSPSHLFLAGESMVPTSNSILRNSYLPYFFVKRLQEQEAIMGERMGGFPVVKVPAEMIDAANSGDAKALASYNSFKKMAINLRIDEQMGCVLPSDCWSGPNGPTPQPMYSVELVVPQGGRGSAMNFETSITRYNTNIMTSVLADFLTLGHEARGTQSLAVTKVDLFFQAIEGFLNSNAAIYNRYALPRIFELNGMDPNVMPQIIPDMAMRVDLDVLSNFVLRLSQSGMPLFPNEDLQTFILDAAGLPDVTDPLALQAAGMNDDQLDSKDEMQQAALETAQNPPKPTPQQSPMQKMILASLARRMIQKQGPRFGIETRGYRHTTRKRHRPPLAV